MTLESTIRDMQTQAITEASKYDLYHKDFSTAMQYAYKMAKKLHGITIDPEEIDSKVATGPRKPSEGKTNKYRLKGDKGSIQIQVYNKGGPKPFELNMYKEDVDLDESTKEYAKSLAKIADKAKKDNITDKDLEALVKLAALMKKEDVDLEEGKLFNDPRFLSQTEKDKEAFTKSWEKHKKMHKLRHPDDLKKGTTISDKIRDMIYKDADAFKKEEADLDEARQLKDPKKEVMVSKGGKVIVIDKKDQDKYLKKGWELAEEDDSGDDEKDTEKKAKKDEAETTGKEKIEINPTVTESAASDARRDMKKDKDLGPRKDSADDDDDAKPQDRTKLDTRNVIMQLKKAADNKNHKVKFDDGKSIKLKPDVVKAALVKFSKLKPNVKEKVQAQMQKSYKDMIKALSSIKEEVDLDEGKQKPYVSSDKDGKHVMSASGEIVKSFKDMDSANAYLKKNYNKLMKEEVDLDEAFSNILFEEIFLEDLYALDEGGLNEYLESLDEEEFSDLEEFLGIGKLAKGVGKLAKGAGKLAVKGVKKGAERLSTKGKADAADKKAAKMDAKAANKERIVKANERIQAAKERIKKLKDKAADADTPEAKKAVADSIAKAKESGKKAVDAKKDAVSASEQKENYSMERMGVSRDLVNSVRDVLMGKRPVEVDEGDKEEYQKFFKAALKKFGVGSPSEFKSDEEKKKFFDYIEKNWTKDEK